MKKLVLKLLRMAKKDGDPEAAALLEYIEKSGLLNRPLVYFSSYAEATFFKWGEEIRVAYHSYGQDEVIKVFHGGSCWSLCE